MYADITDFYLTNDFDNATGMYYKNVLLKMYFFKLPPPGIMVRSYLFAPASEYKLTNNAELEYVAATIDCRNHQVITEKGKAAW